jgi:hypothetical protein
MWASWKKISSFSQGIHQQLPQHEEEGFIEKHKRFVSYPPFSQNGGKAVWRLHSS